MVRAKKRCFYCKSYKVIQRGYCWRRLRTLPIGRKPVYAVIKIRRFYCRQTRFENLMIAEREKHYTHSMENYVMDLCSVMTVRDVSQYTGLHWSTIKEIDSKRLKRNLPRAKDLRELRYIGIDEVSVRAWPSLSVDYSGSSKRKSGLCRTGAQGRECSTVLSSLEAYWSSAPGNNYGYVAAFCPSCKTVLSGSPTGLRCFSYPG